MGKAIVILKNRFFYVVILTVKLSYHEVLRYCFNAREKLYQRKNI